MSSPFSLALAIAFFGNAAGTAAQCVDTAGFVQRAGNDTLVVERVEVARSRIIGFQRSPDGGVRYEMRRDARSGVTLASLSLWAPGASFSTPPMQNAELRIAGDSAVLIVAAGDRGQRQRNAIVPGASILMDAAIGLDEMLVRNVLAHSEQQQAVPTFFVASNGYSPTVRLFRIARDSVMYTRDDSTLTAEMKVDSTGRILSARYHGARGIVEVTRVSCAAIDALLHDRREQ